MPGHRKKPARKKSAAKKPVAQQSYPVTPDGRYFVVRGRLWRTTNPNLPQAEREKLTRALMLHRAEVGRAMKAGDEPREKKARRGVHAAKLALGERGPAWWTDGAPDYNRYLAKNTPYAQWFEALGLEQD